MKVLFLELKDAAVLILIRTEIFLFSLAHITFFSMTTNHLNNKLEYLSPRLNNMIRKSKGSDIKQGWWVVKMPFQTFFSLY